MKSDLKPISYQAIDCRTTLGDVNYHFFLTTSMAQLLNYSHVDGPADKNGGKGHDGPVAEDE